MAGLGWFWRKKPTVSPKANGTKFVGSQIGGKSVINYSYTDMPWKLMAFDIYYFFVFIWALPHILLPMRPADSGDLAELSFMDVTGLRTILDAARRARRAGSAIVIANPLPHIIRLLELTAIDQTLEVQGRPLAPVT